jgi:hypothetical protein
VAFAMTHRARAALDAAEPRPATGIERLEALITQVDTTRAVERAQEPRRLPYIPRRRASG